MNCWAILFFLITGIRYGSSVSISTTPSLRSVDNFISDTDSTLHRRGYKKGKKKPAPTPASSSNAPQGEGSSSRQVSTKPPTTGGIRPGQSTGSASQQISQGAASSSTIDWSTGPPPLDSTKLGLPMIPPPSRPPAKSAQAIPLSKQSSKSPGSSSQRETRNPSLTSQTRSGETLRGRPVDSVTATQEALSRVKITQEPTTQVPTQARSDVARGRSPSGQAPREDRQSPSHSSGSRTASSEGRSTSSEQGSRSPGRRQPQGPQQPTSFEASASNPAGGPPWFPSQKTIIDNYKKVGDIRHLNPTQQERRERLAAVSAVRKATTAKGLARNIRRVDDEALKVAKKTLKSESPLSPEALIFMRQSLGATRNAQKSTSMYSDLEAHAAGLLAENHQYGQAANHASKAVRAHARQALRNAHGKAFDFKWLNEKTKEVVANTPDENKTDQAKAAKIISKNYRGAAEEYHEAHRDYQFIRGELPGSSSDESEKSTFRDVISRPRARRP